MRHHRCSSLRAQARLAFGWLANGISLGSGQTLEAGRLRGEPRVETGARLVDSPTAPGDNAPIGT